MSQRAQLLLVQRRRGSGGAHREADHRRVELKAKFRKPAEEMAARRQQRQEKDRDRDREAAAPPSPEVASRRQRDAQRDYAAVSEATPETAGRDSGFWRANPAPRRYFGRRRPRGPRPIGAGKAGTGMARDPFSSSQRRADMVDDLQNRGPQDRARVNVNEPWEVRWWCKEFGCTEQQLRDAVSKVGVSAEAVRKELTGR